MPRSGCHFFFGGACWHLRAQRRPVEEPRWLRFDLDDLYLNLEVEGEFENRSRGGSGATSTRDYLYVEPALGLGFHGSVYHPNLLEYTADVEGGLTWQRNNRHDAGAPVIDSSVLDPLQRYNANLSILKLKPYAAGLYANKTTVYRSYDFFSRLRIDQLNYGGNAGLSAGPVPFRISARHHEEEQTSSARPISRDENMLSFEASNTRHAGSRTELNFSITDFLYRNIGIPRDEGTYYAGELTDVEKFGRGDWIRMNTVLRYFERDATLNNTENLIGQERIRLEHRDNLESFYDYRFGRRQTGAVRNTSHRASGRVRHQLYESLISSFDAHGALEDTTSGETSTEVNRYGITWNEEYRKRLSETARLRLGYQFRFTHEDRQNDAPVLSILAEPHTLRDGEITFLDQPNVIESTIVITDGTGVIIYAPNIDYLVINRGIRTEIRRVVTGAIPNNTLILAQYDAVAQPSDSFDTVGNAVHARVELFDNLLALYARFNRNQNYGGETLVLQNFTDKLVGSEVTWRWLRFLVEYQDFDSNLSPFSAVRLIQGMAWEPTLNSTLSLDLGQSWTRWPEEDRRVTAYHLISRYKTRLSSHLSLSAEGGFRNESGDGVDQQLFTVRAGLEFQLRQVTGELGYEFNHEDFFQDRWQKHFVYLRARRSF